jgi:hypothetical protein
MSKLEVNAVEPQCGTNLTLGASGDTVIIPSGATISNQGTAAGFGSTGEVSWNTTKITADPGPAVSGVGYFADTSSAAFTITLPASPSAGNVVAISDYSGNFGTNAITVGRNSSNINGSASDFNLSRNNVTAQFIYVDATQGWRVVFTGSQTGEGLQENYVIGTGGTITTCGNCKIHTFTGPGTFTVSQVADCSSNNAVSYMVIAGGGGGGANRGGCGGAGGFREDKSPVTPYTASPLDGAGAITVSAQGYPITVGGGAAPTPTGRGTSGSNSVFSTITSTGGAGGGSATGSPLLPGNNGASGGGAASPGTGGTGNTPPVSPPQGNNGGDGGSPGPFTAGGGGGASCGGTSGSPSSGGAGGAGATTSITGSPVQYAGGGGGSTNGLPAGAAGAGGGGAGVAPGTVGGNGTANTGGGGGGGGGNGPGGSDNDGGSGGSGIVIIRYKFQ